MLPTTPNGAPAVPDATPEPELRNRISSPAGVIRKNQKAVLYIGAVAVLVAATFVSSYRKKPSATPAEPASPVEAVSQDPTASNVAALHAQLAADRRMPAAQAQTPNAYAPDGLPATMAVPPGCLPGQPCPAYAVAGPQQPTAYGGGGGSAQMSPAEQASQQLAAKDRELQYSARFASNLVYNAAAGSANEQHGQGNASTPPTPYASMPAPGQPASLTPPRATGDTIAAATYKRGPEVNLDNAAGQPYVLYEGVELDTVLMNRLDGDAPGPVKVLVSNPVYSHDHQHVLIPDGTIVLGEAKKIGQAGFGQQRRIAVVFHRMLMPDGYSVDLDQFHGLDQIGQEGVKDKVNNHYLQIFGTSIALGVVSGAAQVTQGGSGYTASGGQLFVNGAASGVSQQATTVLDRFIQIPPTITIREGQRVKVYFTQDMLLPAYENHRVAQTF